LNRRLSRCKCLLALWSHGGPFCSARKYFPSQVVSVGRLLRSGSGSRFWPGFLIRSVPTHTNSKISHVRTKPALQINHGNTNASTRINRTGCCRSTYRLWR
jgi:hypothetical protein